MELKKCLLTKNECYKRATKMIPKGIVVHSTGANNPTLKRYVQPDDGIIGKNLYNNDWNRSGVYKCVHAFIGKDKNGNIQVYQTLPFNYAAWGVGNGNKGSYNYNPYGHIQFEICEDGLTNEDYFNNVFDLAAAFCAYLCKEYNFDIDTIISHNEAYKKGYASNHSDCDHWLKKFGKNMNWFREQVKTKMGESITPTRNEKTDILYQAYDNKKKKWWSVITNYNNNNTSGYAGCLGNSIGGIKVKLSNNAKIQIRSHIKGGNWLSWISKWDDTSMGYSGIKGKSIDGIQVKTDVGTVVYRVHIKGGKWLSWIRKVDNSSMGYAGIYGKEIDAIQMYIE